MKPIVRLFEYFKLKGIKPTRFERDTGISNGYFLTQNKRSGDIGTGILSIIIENCLDLNIEWLITGKEPMLKKDIHQLPSEAEMDRLADVEKILVDQIRENYQLKAEIEKLKKELFSLKKNK